MSLLGVDGTHRDRFVWKMESYHLQNCLFYASKESSDMLNFGGWVWHLRSHDSLTLREIYICCHSKLYSDNKFNIKLHNEDYNLTYKHTDFVAFITNIGTNNASSSCWLKTGFFSEKVAASEDEKSAAQLNDWVPYVC